MSLQNVFVLVLQEPKIKNLLKSLTSIDSDYEAIKIFLDYDPTIVKSKYITKYLNSRNKNANRPG